MILNPVRADYRDLARKHFALTKVLKYWRKLRDDRTWL